MHFFKKFFDMLLTFGYILLHFLFGVASSPVKEPYYCANIKLETVQVRHFISGTKDYMSPEAYAGLARFPNY